MDVAAVTSMVLTKIAAKHVETVRKISAVISFLPKCRTLLAGGAPLGCAAQGFACCSTGEGVDSTGMRPLDEAVVRDDEAANQLHIS
jgi:hypothetical protein